MDRAQGKGVGVVLRDPIVLLEARPLKVVQQRAQNIMHSCVDLLRLRANRRRFPADDIEKKLEFLRTDPVASQMTAGREGRIVRMNAHAMSATMRTVHGLETLSQALAGMSFE